MNIELKDKIIYVSSYSTKNKILKKNKQLLDIKFITREDLIKKTFFDYDEKTINYIMKKYNYTSDISKILLENMYYIFINNNLDNKLIFLNKLYNELLSNNLLIIDKTFIELNKQYKIIVLEYDYIDSIFKKTLELYNNYSIEENKYNFSSKKYLKFNSLDEEVDYVFNKISNLLSKGINIDDIKISIPSNEYDYYIYKYSILYTLKVETKTYISSTKEVEVFLNLVKENLSFNDIITRLNKEFYTKEVLNKIITICNKYYWYKGDICNLYNRIKEDCSKCVYKEYIYDNKIGIVNINNYQPSNDEYVFLLGFNDNYYPNIIKDDNYINDYIINKLDLPNTSYIYNFLKEVYYNKILSINNVYITYSLSNKGEELYPNSMLKNSEFILDDIADNIMYSKPSNILKLAKYYDNYYKYNTITNDLIKLHNNLNIMYKIYDNKYNNDTNKITTDLSNKHINLSYTKVDSYNKCSFAYYLKYILKLEEFEETFAARVGTIIHEILSLYMKEDFSLDNEITRILEENEFTSKELLLLDNIFKQLEEVIKLLKEQDNIIGYKNIITEKKYEIKLDELTNFVGIIDKIYNSDNNYVIVDYKSGIASIDCKYLESGLNMQLFIYLYLLTKTKENINITGFYLQYILNFTKKYTINKTIEKLNKDSLKLNGYSINDLETLEEFDENINEDSIIASFKIKKDGNVSSTSKVLEKEEIENYISLVESNINKAVCNIRNANFKINPKVVGGKNIACEYCKFKDVCFSTYQDQEVIEMTSN